MIKKYGITTNNYFDSIQVGDIILPIEDGKIGRWTKCKVVEIIDKYITVEGPLWCQSIWLKEKEIDVELKFITKFDRNGENYSYRYKWNPYIMLDTVTEYMCDSDYDDDIRGDYYCLMDIPSVMEMGIVDKWLLFDVGVRNWINRIARAVCFRN